MPVALCVNHYGAYEHMPETFAELFAYAETNGYEVIDLSLIHIYFRSLYWPCEEQYQDEGQSVVQEETDTRLGERYAA